MTVSKTEAITAWRAICSGDAPSGGTHAPGYTPRVKQPKTDEAEAGSKATEQEPLLQVAKDAEDGGKTVKDSLKDGRDVYLLRFESDRMLKTGR